MSPRIEGYIDPLELLVERPGSTFLVHVRGDEGGEDGILAGDVLVVDRELPPGEGMMIVAIVGGELTVKRFRRRGLRLVESDEKGDRGDSRGGQVVEVWGVVTWVLRKV